MALLETVYWSQDRIAAFEDECFRSWLNRIDARIDYEVRKQISLVEWRNLFDFGYSEKDACLMALTGRTR